MNGKLTLKPNISALLLTVNTSSNITAGDENYKRRKENYIGIDERDPTSLWM